MPKVNGFIFEYIIRRYRLISVRLTRRERAEPAGPNGAAVCGASRSIELTNRSTKRAHSLIFHKKMLDILGFPGWRLGESRWRARRKWRRDRTPDKSRKLTVTPIGLWGPKEAAASRKLNDDAPFATRANRRGTVDVRAGSPIADNNDGVIGSRQKFMRPPSTMSTSREIHPGEGKKTAHHRCTRAVNISVRTRAHKLHTPIFTADRSQIFENSRDR